MAEENLKTKTISSMLWSAVQRFGVLFLSFISNLILARFLTPEDYGAIGMLTLFISLGETFVDSGFGAALIQKTDPTEEDYSTVFWTNLLLSILIYFILYFSAPLISRFYNMEILTQILRVKAICLIIQAFRIIQTTRLQKKLNFKKISIVYLTASAISTAISIVCAVLGFGVWSLVIKTLLDIFIRTLIFWIIEKWKPLFHFSKTSFKELFSFGGVMLSTSLIIKLYSNLQTLIIGKVFSATDLGYYTQAKKLEQIPTTAFEQIVNQVTFPIFSKLKDDTEKMKNGFRKCIVSISYIVCPMMMFFFICSDFIFKFLFTSKWDQSIPYFRYLCLLGMIYIINTMNTNLIKASGKKKLYFNFQLIKRLCGLIIILISVRFGMTALLIALVAIEYLFFIINGIVTSKTIQYSFFRQIIDLLPNYILSIGAAVIVYIVFKNFSFSNLITIILEFLLYITIFLLISGLLKFKGFVIYKEIITNRLHKGKTGK